MGNGWVFGGLRVGCGSGSAIPTFAKNRALKIVNQGGYLSRNSRNDVISTIQLLNCEGNEIEFPRSNHYRGYESA
jgi:hypothetical protein